MVNALNNLFKKLEVKKETAVLHSDNGSEFKNKLMREIISSLGLKHVFGAPYHPQSQGVVERLNRTIKGSLAIMSEDLNGAWSTIYDNIVKSYNDTYHSTIKCSPNEAEHRCTSVLSLGKNPIKEVLDEAARIKYNIEQIKKLTVKAAEAANKQHMKGKKVMNLEMESVVVVRLARIHRKKNEPEFSRKGKIAQIGTGFNQYYAKIRWDHTGGIQGEQPNTISGRWYHFQDLRPYEV